MSNTLPSLSELAKILSHIDPSDREKWYQTFLIAGRDYNQDRSVFDICQNWSRQYQGRTAEDERHERHDFFKGSKGDGAHIGTLIMWAKERGYKPPKPERNEDATPELAPIVWKQAPGPVLHKVPETASEGAKKLQAVTQLSSRTLLRNLLLGCITETDKVSRSEFLAKHKHQLRFYPEDVRTYFDAMTCFSTDHPNFEYCDFVEWANLNVPGFDEPTMFDLTTAQEVISPDLYEDFFDKMFKASWQLLSAQMARDLIDRLESSNFDSAHDAANKFSQDILISDDHLVRHGMPALSAEPSVLIPQIIDPTLSCRYYIPTGYTEIDNIIYGYRRDEVTIFAAHSGMGKTWYGVDTVRLALQKGLRVLFVSTEMEPSTIDLRFFCNITSTENPRPFQIAGPTPTENEKKMIQERIDYYLSKVPHVTKFCDESNAFLEIIGNNSGGISIEDIERTVEIASISKPIDLVVVDYLQNVTNDHFGNRNTLNYERVKNVMERLTRLSRKCHCATLALAQLNNPNRKTSASATPNLYDIADATGVVRDAAAVLVMYRDANEITKLKVAKSRYGNPKESDLTITRAAGSRFSFFDSSNLSIPKLG